MEKKFPHLYPSSFILLPKQRHGSGLKLHIKRNRQYQHEHFKRFGKYRFRMEVEFPSLLAHFCQAGRLLHSSQGRAGKTYSRKYLTNSHPTGIVR